MNLERRSFTNLTFFYFDELNRIIGGVSPLKVFSQATRRTIRKWRLIETYYTARGHPNSRVTDAACGVLGEWTNIFEVNDS